MTLHAGLRHRAADPRGRDLREPRAAASAHDHDAPAHRRAATTTARRHGRRPTASSAWPSPPLANLVTAIGFGLLLVAASEFAGGIAGWRQGLLWGLAGFAAFTLAPGLGLPPELPAMPAAELVPRQAWWIATVAADRAPAWR